MKKVIILLLLNILFSLSYSQVGYDGTNPIGNFATSLGSNTTATGYASFAIGNGSLASGVYSTAIGKGNASGSYAIAMGLNSYTTGNYSSSIGINCLAEGDHSIAIGRFAKTSANNSIVIGRGSTSTSSYLDNDIPNSLMIGFNSTEPTLFVGPAANQYATGNVGIATKDPKAKLHVNGSAAFLSSGSNAFKIVSSPEVPQRGISIGNDPDGSFNFHIVGGVNNEAFNFNNGSTKLMTITAEGNIGINISNPQAKLHIFHASEGGVDDVFLIETKNETGNVINFKVKNNGYFWAREVIVTLNTFPDYVFGDTYKLMSLEETENFIKENKHLPGVPSESEVVKNGINVGEMNALLLEKIEELTLYVINLKKENDKLLDRLEKLNTNH